MPNRVTHRGAAPGDDVLFGAEALPLLREATSDLCWLLSRGYAIPPPWNWSVTGTRFASVSDWPWGDAPALMKR